MAVAKKKKKTKKLYPISNGEGSMKQGIFYGVSHPKRC